MTDLFIMLAAIAIDWCLGDPRSMPHLVNYFAWLAKQFEQRLWRKGKSAFWYGALFYILVMTGGLLPWALIGWCFEQVWIPASWLWSVLLIFQSIAYRDLVRHVNSVLVPLEQGDLIRAREFLSWVVGRDTEHLDENEISRAAIETLAESLNDGVIAPLFWALLFGPLGAIAFRITNTLDSLVGHRDERYEWFGKVSARMDDLLGFFPARITGFLIWMIASRRGWSGYLKDAKTHSSLNAGYPESAMARAIGVKLGGTNCYAGEIHEGRVFNHQCRTPEFVDIRTALRFTKRVYLGVIILLIAFAVYFLCN
jgi:adenosylcobinamide-phosphate synthase